MSYVKRPAFNAFGTKWLLAKWIIKHIPPHLIYVEPMALSAAALLLKRPSRLEVYNDLNREVVNFFEVLRDEPEELVRRLNLTPWAREEFRRAHEPTDDHMEAARRFYVRVHMSVGGRTDGVSYTTSGWRCDTKIHGNTPRARTNVSKDHLLAVARRMAGVQIECDSYESVIERYDGPSTVFYVDPPYVTDTRAQREAYSHEWTDCQHEALCERLLGLEGHILLSGYENPIYKDMLEEQRWERVDKETTANGSTKRTESLWLAPRTTEALGRGAYHGGLFAKESRADTKV